MPKKYGGYSLDDIFNAVIQIESSGGKNVGPRYEAGFQKKYLQGKPQWEQAAKKHGWEAVSASYGPAQILFPVAVELGFQGTPEELANPEVNREYFDKKFIKDFASTKGDVRKTLLRYNGGGDKFYAAKVMKHLPNLEQKTNPLEDGFRKTNRALNHMGFEPLNAQEIEQVLEQVEPQSKGFIPLPEGVSY